MTDTIQERLGQLFVIPIIGRVAIDASKEIYDLRSQLAETKERIRELESYRRTPNQLAQAILREEDAHLETARELDEAKALLGRFQFRCSIPSPYPDGIVGHHYWGPDPDEVAAILGQGDEED